MKKILASPVPDVSTPPTSSRNPFVQGLMNVLTYGLPAASLMYWAYSDPEGAEESGGISFASTLIQSSAEYIPLAATSWLLLTGARAESISIDFRADLEPELVTYKDLLMYKYDEAATAHEMLVKEANAAGVEIEYVLNLFRQKDESDDDVYHRVTKLCNDAFDLEIFELSYDLTALFLGNRALTLTNKPVSKNVQSLAEKTDPGKFQRFSINLPGDEKPTYIFGHKEKMAAYFKCDEGDIQDRLNALEASPYKLYVSLGRLSGISKSDAMLYAGYRAEFYYKDFTYHILRTVDSKTQKKTLKKYIKEISNKTDFSITNTEQDIKLFTEEGHLNLEFVNSYPQIPSSAQPRLKDDMLKQAKGKLSIEAWQTLADIFEAVELVYYRHRRPAETMQDGSSLSRFYFPDSREFPAHRVSFKVFQELFATPNRGDFEPEPVIYKDLLMYKYDEAATAHEMLIKEANAAGVKIEDVLNLFRQKGESDNDVYHRVRKLCNDAFDLEIFKLSYDLTALFLGNRALTLISKPVLKNIESLAEKTDPGKFQTFSITLPGDEKPTYIFGHKEKMAAYFKCDEGDIQDRLNALEASPYKLYVSLGRLSGISKSDAMLYAGYRAEFYYKDFTYHILRTVDSKTQKKTLKKYIKEISNKTNFSIKDKKQVMTLFTKEGHLNLEFVNFYPRMERNDRSRAKDGMLKQAKDKISIEAWQTLAHIFDAVELVYYRHLRPPETMEDGSLSRFCFPDCKEFPAHRVSFKVFQELFATPKMD